METSAFLQQKKSILLFCVTLMALLFSAIALAGPTESDPSEPPATGGESVPGTEIGKGGKPLPPQYHFTGEAKWRNDDCDQNSFKAAFITFDNNYISHHTGFELEDYNYPSDYELSVIKKAKSDLPAYFNYATEGLGQLDTSYPLVIMPLKPNYVAIEQQNPAYPYEIRANAVANDFYEQHPDEFDFIFFVSSAEFIGGHSGRISGLTKGIGLPDNMIGYKSYYGSQGKLKQTIILNINHYLPSNSIYSSDQTELHEIGHQWTAYYGDSLEQALGFEFKKNSSHLNQTIQTKDLDNFNVMHSYGRWKPSNNPDWYGKLGVGEGLDKNVDYSVFHPFTLYMMGLLPEERYNEEFVYFDADHPNFNSPNPNATQPAAGTLTVHDLIEILGPRECMPPDYGEGNINF